MPWQVHAWVMISGTCSSTAISLKAIPSSMVLLSSEHLWLAEYELTFVSDSDRNPFTEALGHSRIFSTPRVVVVPLLDRKGPGFDELRQRTLREAFLLIPRIFPIIWPRTELSLVSERAREVRLGRLTECLWSSKSDLSTMVDGCFGGSCWNMCSLSYMMMWASIL